MKENTDYAEFKNNMIEVLQDIILTLKNSGIESIRISKNRDLAPVVHAGSHMIVRHDFTGRINLDISVVYWENE